MPSPPSPSIAFAGGGSGGHIYPALAIHDRLLELDPEGRHWFICSTRAVDRTILQAAGVQFEPIPAEPLRLRPAGAVRFLRAYTRCTSRLVEFLREQGVGHVAAMGGFVAAPAVAAAGRLGVGCTLVNLDAVPGRANRSIARRCDRVLSAVPVARPRRFADEIVGMPIRQGAVCSQEAGACRIDLQLDPDRLTLLIVGGSQGARSINGMMAELARCSPEILGTAQVYHLAGDRAQADQVRQAYDGAGIPCRVDPFTERMDLAWGAADLAVSRAGAGSVAEAAANRVPTLFLPYPFHRDLHQRHNAEPLVADGAALLGEDLVDPPANLRANGPLIAGLLAEPDRRETMRRALTVRPRTDAARRVARLLIDSCGS